MNKPLLRSIMAIHKDTQNTLASVLGLPQSAVSNRMNGTIDFRVSEINCIRKRYKLTDSQTVDIFFEKDVS